MGSCRSGRDGGGCSAQLWTFLDVVVDECAGEVFRVAYDLHLEDLLIDQQIPAQLPYTQCSITAEKRGTSG